MGDQILRRLGDIVPPRRQESILATRDLLGENLDALVIERREATEEGVENAAQSPHINTLRVSLILDNLGRGVADSSTGRHSLAVPDDLGQTKIGDLNHTNAAGAFSGNEFAFIDLVLVPRLTRFGVFARDEVDGVEEKIFGFNVTVAKVSKARGRTRARRRLGLTDARHRMSHEDTQWPWQLEE